MSILTLVKTGSLGKRVRRIVQLQQTYGNVRVAYAILRRMLRLPLLRRTVQLCAVDFWRLPLTKPTDPVPPSSLFSVRLAERDQLPELAEYYSDAIRIDNRFAAGNLCVAAYSQGTIGAAVWLVMGPGHYVEDWCDLRCNFRFPEGTAWTFDGKGTRLGAWGTMMKQLPQLLDNCEAEEIATIIDSNNWPSLEAHRSLGYEAVGVLLHMRVLGITRHWFKPRGHWWQRLPSTIGNVEVIKKPIPRSEPSTTTATLEVL